MHSIYRHILCTIFTSLVFCQTLDIETLEQLVVDGHAFAVDLDQRRRVDRQVDVGRLLLAHQAQNPLHRAHVFPQIRVLSLFLDRCHALLT